MMPEGFSTLATVNSTSVPAGMALLAVVISITRVAKVADPSTLFGVVKAMVGVPTFHPVCVVAVTSGRVSLILPPVGISPIVLNLTVAVDTTPGVVVAGTTFLPLASANVVSVPKQ